MFLIIDCVCRASTCFESVEQPALVGQLKGDERVPRRFSSDGQQHDAEPFHAQEAVALQTVPLGQTSELRQLHKQQAFNSDIGSWQVIGDCEL